MPQIKPLWEEISEFNQLAEKLIEKYPERFGELKISDIVAYGCVNKK